MVTDLYRASSSPELLMVVGYTAMEHSLPMRAEGFSWGCESLWIAPRLVLQFFMTVGIYSTILVLVQASY